LPYWLFWRKRHCNISFCYRTPYRLFRKLDISYPFKPHLLTHCKCRYDLKPFSLKKQNRSIDAVGTFVPYYADVKIGANSKLVRRAIEDKWNENDLSKVIMQHPENAKELLDGFVRQVEAEIEKRKRMKPDKCAYDRVYTIDQNNDPIYIF
jgi:hypothetical protein